LTQQKELFATLHIARRESMKKIWLSLVYIFAAACVCPAQSLFYFPQIVDGGQAGGAFYETVIAITNLAPPGSAAASGAITLIQDDGTPMNIPFTDDQNQPVASGNTIPFQLAGGQTKVFFSNGPDGSITIPPLKVGFAAVSSNLPVTGTAIYYEFGPNGRIGEAGVPASTPLTQQAIFATKGGSNTGIAMANPGTSTATITFQALDLNGISSGASVTRTLAANNHTAFMFSDLFSSIGKEFIGTMRITSDAPVVTSAFIIEKTGMFATFPVFPLK
jgi:hypothetical protein